MIRVTWPEDRPVNFAFMAYTSPCSSSSSNLDTEVSTCSKACLKSYETLKEHYDYLTKDFNKSQFNLGFYKAGLESFKARLEVYKKNEAVFEDDIKILKLDVMLRDNAITELRQKFKKAKKERDDLKLTLEKFKGSSKNLSRLLNSQQSDMSKTGLGYDNQGVDSQVESVTSLSNITKSKVKSSETKLKNVCAPIIKDWVSDSEDEDEIETESKQIKPSYAKVKFIKSTKHVKSPRKFVKQEESNRQKNTLGKPIKVLEVNNVTTAETKAVVSAVQGNRENVVKSSACWIWRPTGNVIDHISKDDGSYMLKRFNYVDLQGRLKKEIFVKPFLTKKVFANMKRVGTGFSGAITPLFETMMVQAPKEVGEIPTNTQDTPILSQPSSSQPLEEA
nr:hypothetical protein [Tanacetum cinerariifolium]